mmetsp:Transcript_23722/g.40237  ORF Transcript_23722/g.40237 Transcript_23722/m.40237 type:complete len:147 (-) Transcript_23722:174-614(-)
MLPHIHAEGVYICEDLSTSWGKRFQGRPYGNASDGAFLSETMFGYVHQSLDWLNSMWIPGGVQYPRDFFKTAPPGSMWRTVVDQVKHIHLYNQFVVYEKGKTWTMPHVVGTIGTQIPYWYSGEREKVDWMPILNKLQNLSGSPWKW